MIEMDEFPAVRFQAAQPRRRTPDRPTGGCPEQRVRSSAERCVHRAGDAAGHEGDVDRAIEIPGEIAFDEA